MSEFEDVKVIVVSSNMMLRRRAEAIVRTTQAQWAQDQVAHSQTLPPTTPCPRAGPAWKPNSRTTGK